MSPPIVRFAPSPTGLLHVGNVRAALFNWLFARRHGGRFILRFDDTDRARSKPEYEVAIGRDLAWLGLDWDGKERQSDRLSAYDEARDRLVAAGRLYPCYETPEELEFKRKRLLAQGKLPVYDRAALRLDATARSQLESEGRRPHWRFRLASEEVRWDDLVHGGQHVDEASQSDPVLVRADGSYIYSFTSVVDDIAFGITHVIRGPAPRCRVRASRRSRAERPTRSMSKVATRPESDTTGSTGSAVPSRASKASIAARFSEEELAHLSARTLHLLPYADVRDRLSEDFGETFWLAVRGNLTTLADCKIWAGLCAVP